jgi:Gpi18-like mannosyltransferase
MLESIKNSWKRNRTWIGRDIIVPFSITRSALLLVGWFSQYFPPDLNYPAREAVQRGWHFSSHRLLDIWGRWDSGWYASIVFNGYTIDGELGNSQSNIAFFPLYPYLVKIFFQLLPARFQTLESMLIIGVIVSNIFFVGALILFYKLVIVLYQNRRVAQRAVLYLLLFPSGFFFSCFYTEATYLFFSIASFYAASKQRWRMACILGFFVGIARPLGVVIALPLGLEYMKIRGWRIHRIDKDAAWFLLIPLGFFLFLFSFYRTTGTFFAPMVAQSSWGKVFAMPWETLLKPMAYFAFITPFDNVFIVGFILLSIVALIRLPSYSYGIYSLLLLIPPLMTGNSRSLIRYCTVVFPVFIILALWGKRYSVNQFVTILFLTLQLLFMVAWSQFYWVA